MPFEIPESWEWVMVQDIFELNPKNKVTDEITAGFIPMELVSAGFGFEHSYTTQEWGKIKKGYSHFQNGDIGIAKISPCFENRKSTIFYNLPNNIGAGTTELVVLRGHIVFTKFFLYLFQTAWYISEGTKYFKGVVGQQRVHKDIFTTLNIPLPPLAEQQRIVAEVEKWFALIDELEANKEDLRDYIKQVKSKVLDLAIHGKLVPQDPNDEPAIELLKRINPNFQPCDTSHYENMPTGWSVCKLCDIAKITAGGTPSRKIISFWDGGTIPWLKIADMTASGKYIRTASEYITEDGMKNSSAKLMRKGTLLYTIFASIGEVGILDFDATCNQAIANIDLHISEMTDYIYYYLRNLQAYMYSISKGCTQQNINQGILKSATIPLPPLTEQKRIADQIEIIFASLDTITAEL